MNNFYSYDELRFKDFVHNFFSYEDIPKDKLNEACELLKSNIELRKNFNENLYKKIFFKLKSKLIDGHLIDDTTVLILKMLRNASGVNKNEFNEYENFICELLIEYLLNQINLKRIDISTNYEIFINLILQYFANLIQGNSKSDKYLSKWFKIACDLIECEESLKSYDESNWSSIFLNSIFENNFIRIVIVDDEYFKRGLTMKNKILILKMLNQNHNKIRNENEFIHLTKFYERLSNNFIEVLFINVYDKKEKEFMYLNDLMNELKLILTCLNDILSVNKNEIKFREIIQKDEITLRNTCSILNKIHFNKLIQEKVNENQDYESFNGYENFKLELIRLIGILVFENNINCNIVKQTETLKTIVENVNIDIYNPFIREWSIIALRYLSFSNEI